MAAGGGLIIAAISYVFTILAETETSRGPHRMLTVFRRDGTLDLHKSNIVAGPGVAYSGGPNASLLVVGRPDEQRLRYRIDGYVLELTADDGAVERHFIARFGDDKADDPHSLYIGGEMLWDRDKDDKPTKK